MCRGFKATIVIAMMLAFISAEAMSCLGRRGDKTRCSIVGRTGDALAVRTGDGSITVVLIVGTKVQKPKGLGLRKAQMSFSALIPGSGLRWLGSTTLRPASRQSDYFLRGRLAIRRGDSSRPGSNAAGGRGQPAEHRSQQGTDCCESGKNRLQ
jgi:hypothetical protein